MNLILGTATFNPGYGIANQNGEENEVWISELIEFAQSNGINSFDTAPAYGRSELLLGKFLDKTLKPRISSKVGGSIVSDPSSLRMITERSLKNLNVDNLETLYFHNEDDLFGDSSQKLIFEIEKIYSEGLINEVGISLYDIKKLKEILDRFPIITRIQLPENICDRRLIDVNILETLAKTRCSFTVRSVFLQGILLMEPNTIPLHLNSLIKNVNSLKNFAEKNSLTPLDLCISYVKQIKWSSSVIIGAKNLHQIKQIINSRDILPNGWSKEVETILNEFVDPRNWTK